MPRALRWDRTSPGPVRDNRRKVAVSAENCLRVIEARFAIVRANCNVSSSESREWDTSFHHLAGMAREDATHITSFVCFVTVVSDFDSHEWRSQPFAVVAEKLLIRTRLKASRVAQA